MIQETTIRWLKQGGGNLKAIQRLERGAPFTYMLSIWTEAIHRSLCNYPWAVDKTWKQAMLPPPGTLLVTLAGLSVSELILNLKGVSKCLCTIEIDQGSLVGDGPRPLLLGQINLCRTLSKEPHWYRQGGENWLKDQWKEEVGWTNTGPFSPGWQNPALQWGVQTDPCYGTTLFYVYHWTMPLTPRNTHGTYPVIRLK